MFLLMQEGDIAVEIESGQSIEFDASCSTDPDGDNLYYEWFIYPEAGTFEATDKEMLNYYNKPRVSVSIHNKAKDKSIHLILKLKDQNEPSLISYRRIIINVN